MLSSKKVCKAKTQDFYKGKALKLSTLDNHSLIGVIANKDGLHFTQPIYIVRYSRYPVLTLDSTVLDYPTALGPRLVQIIKKFG